MTKLPLRSGASTFPEMSFHHCGRNLLFFRKYGAGDVEPSGRGGGACTEPLAIWHRSSRLSVAVHPAEEEVDTEIGDQHRHESDQEIDMQEPLRAEAAQRLAV